MDQTISETVILILRHLVLNARYEALVRVGPVKTLHTMGSGGGEFCKI